MSLVFWVFVLVVVYAYVGYAAWLWMRSGWRPRPVHGASVFPTVSIVMAVHNEATALPKKLHNLSTLDYPTDRLEIIVVSDGSTDLTNQILTAYATGWEFA